MTLKTGNQLKAARAMAGDLTQSQLAEVAGVNVNTIRTMEGCGGNIITSSLVTVERVQKALENAGVFFILEDGAIGVGTKDR